MREWIEAAKRAAGLQCLAAWRLRPTGWQARSAAPWLAVAGRWESQVIATSAVWAEVRRLWVAQSDRVTEPMTAAEALPYSRRSLEVLDSEGRGARPPTAEPAIAPTAAA